MSTTGKFQKSEVVAPEDPSPKMSTTNRIALAALLVSALSWVAAPWCKEVVEGKFQKKERVVPVDLPPKGRQMPDATVLKSPPGPKAKLYAVQVMIEQGIEAPHFSVDGVQRNAVAYNGQIVWFQLTAGAHEMKAEGATRVCEATFSIPETKQTEAMCRYK